MMDKQVLDDEIVPAWKKFKEIIDKYPNAFKMMYLNGLGHVMSIDLDKIYNPQDANIIKPSIK